MVENFPRAASCYGLITSTKKTEGMLHSRRGPLAYDSAITIIGQQLKAVDKFCDMGDNLSQNAIVGDEVTHSLHWESQRCLWTAPSQTLVKLR